MKRGTRYRYVDFAAAAQPGFRNHVVPVEQVPDLVARHGHGECYASLFHFSPEILLYLAEHRVDGRPSIAGYDGRVWAPFLALDIDAHGQERLPDALTAARQVYELLVHRWGTPPGAIHPYFSGAKGFHLLVDTRCFGRLSPSTRMPRLFARWRLGIVDALPASLQPFLDLSIGDKVRLLRLANTPHRSTGLFKVRLRQEELVHARVDEILQLARAPRSLGAVTAVVHSAFLRTYPYAYGCHDEVIRQFCPFAENLAECEDYREQHPRMAAGRPEREPFAILRNKGP